MGFGILKSWAVLLQASDANEYMHAIGAAWNVVYIFCSDLFNITLSVMAATFLVAGDWTELQSEKDDVKHGVWLLKSTFLKRLIIHGSVKEGRRRTVYMIKKFYAEE